MRCDSTGTTSTSRATPATSLGDPMRADLCASQVSVPRVLSCSRDVVCRSNMAPSSLGQTHGKCFTAGTRLALLAPPAPEKNQRPQSQYEGRRARRILTAPYWLPGSTFSGFAAVRWPLRLHPWIHWHLVGRLRKRPPWTDMSDLTSLPAKEAKAVHRRL